MTEEEFRAIVKTNIRNFMNYHKLTQIELSKKLDISINFLSEIEKGKKWISPASMVKFASAFNIEPYELFKPVDVPAPTFSAMFEKYNDEVVKAISNTLKQICGHCHDKTEIDQ